ncbi:MAG: tRNA (adenosine(37)-N6)-threonylcarbamoyltransferase complex dimerization subunit type 1 TsaB [Pseudomonadota bacterium]
MTIGPLVLGFDTSGAHCAAALVQRDQVISANAEDMVRGQAERLVPMLEDVLIQASVAWQDLSVLAVGIGPGNFTGIRIGVATARGLALGLSCPAIGVSGFEARSFLGLPARINGPKDQVYALQDGTPILTDAPPATACAPVDLARAIARVGAARPLGSIAPPAPLYIKPADAAPARDAPPRILP